MPDYFFNPQRNSRKPVFGFRLLGVKRAICKVLDNNKRSSENRFSDDLSFMGLIELEWRYRFERMQAGSVALWCL